ncbi:hypothetical protein Cs7R123_60960 [Catellatospora sp. TT07R-123]|uniref:hypothetical protein n=1 Tax=Catellatospora sp. TT07R-123 TaxID=2733863 RepID=UPI001AFD252B|nr:hypothetical protein [Catellatospora sp. TT07R-123]GHJ48754.1 hypothetical protein Cs7R123_60960 [Catellatospora sp. TT07R-123]
MTANLSVPALRRRIFLIGLPMAGGAGLVLHILTDISLPLAIGAFALLGAAVFGFVLSRLDPAGRRALRRRAGVGLVAGLIGTLAYDAARYGVVALFDMSFKPFHVFHIFGELFIGTNHPDALIFAVGLAYHISNGTFFGLAYTMVFRRPSWWTGALWGIGLELCMAFLYPTWLRIQMLNEFLEVSALGHVVYGATLGAVAAAGISRLAARSTGPAAAPVEAPAPNPSEVP